MGLHWQLSSPLACLPCFTGTVASCHKPLSMSPSDTPKVNPASQRTSLAIPMLAIIALAIVSIYDGRLTSTPYLIALLTVGMILIAWKRSIQKLVAESGGRELQPEEVGALKPLLVLFIGFYVACVLLLGCLWYFDLPHLLPAFCGLWFIRKELWLSLLNKRQGSPPIASGSTSTWLRWLAGLVSIYLSTCAIMFLAQRSLLFMPSQVEESTQLTPWSRDGETIGYCREVSAPQTVWLMMHGNAGQAAVRDYVLPRMSSRDPLYVLEYPGYGSRPGRPGREAFNQAAAQAYRFLRQQFPQTPIGVIGESIGSGPACALANEDQPPDKIVLIVPFDSLAQVVKRHYFWLPVKWLLLDNWNNVDALWTYQGPVVIYGAADDEVIPVEHARNLARNIPNSTFVEIGGGHNDWSLSEAVKIQGH